MSKINILDKSVFNMIAAGEVVDKPASVVKELVENSIDAKATKITIEILDGGIKKIRVSDNGEGIEKYEMPKAFLPHATSKICTKEDLDKIGTLGFRGEALSSIGAVAKVTLTSKPQKQSVGSSICCNGGELSAVNDAPCIDGTNILVEDLFYCVPARAKFLRKSKLEEAEITNYVTRLILANPHISIKYIADGKNILSSPGTSLEDAIYAIYGKSTLDNLLHVSFTNNIVKCEGYISKTTYLKPNRTYQTLIVNGRYVINTSIAAAILKAYEPYLMKGNFPFYVLSLTIPLDKVDVNVHPNKLDIKFENSNQIFVIFLNEISKILLESSNINRVNKDDQIESEAFKFNIHNLDQNTGHNYKDFVVPKNTVIEVNIDSVPSEETVDLTKLNNTPINNDTNKNKLREDLGQFLNKNDNNFEVWTDNGFSDKLVNIAANKDEIKEEYRVVGVLFKTYILIEKQDEILFIDQHAAHERILYDQFVKEFESQSLVTQPLLIPYILSLNTTEKSFIADNLAVFNELGFNLEEFGYNSYKINEVPMLLKDINIEDFFDNILKDVTNKVITSKSQIIKDYLAKSACRSAVKANDDLKNEEIDYLLKLLKDTPILHCPHGRPIITSVTKTDIEKWFKRIV